MTSIIIRKAVDIKSICVSDYRNLGALDIVSQRQIPIIDVVGPTQIVTDGCGDTRFEVSNPDLRMYLNKHLLFEALINGRFDIAHHIFEGVPLDAQGKEEFKRAISERFKSPVNAYAISAHPDKNNHVPHEVCAFSTLEGAQKYMPKNNSSYDDEDNVHWTYSITVRAYRSGERLDVGPPSSFPYTGW